MLRMKLISRGSEQESFRVPQANPSYHLTERFHRISFLSDAAVPAGQRDDALRIVRELEAVAADSASTTVRHHLAYARAVLADEEDAGGPTGTTLR